MKFLKKFNESKKRYVEITFHKYTILSSNMINWKKNEIDHIKNNLSLHNLTFYPPYDKGPMAFAKPGKFSLFIYSIDDGWYLTHLSIKNEHLFFKCDQEGGLNEMIKDYLFNSINEELNSKYSKEVEIIYKDKNIVCMLPKSQMTSNMYGKNANWCQLTKSGFNMWTKYYGGGILIRFLFKTGRKIRFSYFGNNTFYWANETGYHVLSGENIENLFNPKLPKDKERDIEKDILEHIKLIPDKCKQNVISFLKKHKNGYDYIYRDEEYTNLKHRKIVEIVNKLKNKEIKGDKGYLVIYYKNYKNPPVITINYCFNNEKTKTEEFDVSKLSKKVILDIENRFNELHDLILNK